MSAQKVSIPLFNNKNKKNERQPDFNSTFEVEEKFVLKPDQKYSIAGWRKTSKNGLEYYSLLIQEYEEKPANKEKAKPVTQEDALKAIGYEVEKTNTPMDDEEVF